MMDRIWLLLLGGMLMGCPTPAPDDDDAGDDDVGDDDAGDDDAGDDDAGDDDVGDDDAGDDDGGDDDAGDDDIGDDDAGDDDAGDDDAGDDDAGDDDAGDDDAGDDDADPAADGPHPWTGTSATFSSPALSTAVDIPLQIYLPDAVPAAPIVLLLHGFQLGPSDYASYGTHLASWGYAAVLPQLPGGLLSSPTHRELKLHVRALLDWIDAVAADPSGAFGGRADPSLLALAGHSMGGKIALLVASEDNRPDLVVGIDPVDSGGGPLGPSDPVDYPSVTPELMPSIATPLLLIGETVNATSLFGPACAPADQNFEQYYAAATSPALVVDVSGANHMAFLDNPLCLPCLACPAGTADSADVRRLTRELLTAFLQQRLDGETWPDTYLGGAALNARQNAGELTWSSKNGF